MSVFKFEAINIAGEDIVGFINSDSLEQAKDKLTIRGYEDAKIKKYKLFLSHNAAGPNELSILCRQLACVTDSDISLLEGLVIVAEQTKHIGLIIALHDVYDDICEEKTFVDAVTSHHIFPDYLVSLIGIGESGDKLQKVFYQAAQYYDREYKIKVKIREAVAYPCILTIMMIWIIGLLIMRVLPMFEDMLLTMGGELPAITTVLIDVSSFVAIFAPIILACLAILLVLYMYISKTEKGLMISHRILLIIPIYSRFHKKLLASRFAMGMGLLLDSGISMSSAIEKASYLIGNSYVSKRFKEASENIKEGKSFTRAIAELHIFPSMLIRIVSIGEKTGKLADMLTKSSTFYNEEVDKELTQLTSIIEPLLIVILSIIVGIILLALIMPLINIMSLVS